MRISVWIPALLGLALLNGSLHGQDTRSMMFGRVLDPQSSAVAGAKVVVTNTDTGTSISTTTNQTGYYEASLLLPGSYKVSAEFTGFKTTVRSGIGLPAGTRAEIDLTLELGTVSESVSVTADAPLLETSAVTSGQIYNSRFIMNMPVLNNSTVQYAKFSPGVAGGGVNNYVSLHSHTNASGVSPVGAGGRNEWTIDGTPNQGVSRRIAYLPYNDTIQEFKVETSNFDASVGHSTGLSVVMMTKAGANELHGTATEQHWQQRWQATPFFVKQQYYSRIAAAEAAGDKALADQLRKEPKQVAGNSNNYAATIGGPVVIPKLINGRNKLFFFFSFNGFKDNKAEEASQLNKTVPTPANRKGDFSELLKVKNGPTLYQIYDPLSVRPDPARPAHFIRDPFSGNVLPTSRILNPAYSFYEKVYPNPNAMPADPSVEPVNNYRSVGQKSLWDYKAYSGRYDYQHSNNHRFFARWSYNDWNDGSGNWTYETMPGLFVSGANRHNHGASADWVWTKSAATLFNVTLGANEYREGSRNPGTREYRPSQVGLPKYLDEKAGDQHILPLMMPAGYNPVGAVYSTFAKYQTLSGKLDVSHIRGNHSVRVGFNGRELKRTGGGGGITSGAFSFGNDFTRRNDDTFTPAGSIGHSWAAFMLGIPTVAQNSVADSYAMHSPVYGWYAQDNWRVTARLTLTAGLRFEYELGPTERFNRMLAGFDLAAKLPITDAALAAYQKNPIPEKPASAFSVLGGSLYAGLGSAPRNWVASEFMWMPRVGAAYKLTNQLVVRAGYGLYYDSFNVLENSPNQLNYTRDTVVASSNDFGLTWTSGNPRQGVAPISDPFPLRADGTRFDAPLGNALGLNAVTGGNGSWIDYNAKRSRVHRWRVGLQRQIGQNMVVEAAYVGSLGDRIAVGRNLRALPEQYWASGDTRNSAIDSNLNSNVPNPFLLANYADLRSANPLVHQNMSRQSFFLSSTIRKHQLIRAFPHLTGLSRTGGRDDPYGHHDMHSMQLTLNRRFAHGLQLAIAYTRLSVQETTFYLDEFDPLLSTRPGTNGRPHRLTPTAVYEFPFGKAKRWARTGVLNILFGGWQMAGTYEFQNGALLNWGNYFYNGDPAQVANPGAKSLNHWFNTDNFEQNPSRGPGTFHRRVFPVRIDGVRSDGTSQINANLQREFKFQERAALQLRFEALNLQNRSLFEAPDNNPYSTNFGKVVQQTQALNRFIQIQGRIVF